MQAKILTWFLFLCSTQAFSGGMFCHYLVTKRAVELVRHQPLRQLLSAHDRAFQNGAIYADAGYLLSNFGEFSHWQNFLNPYAKILKEKCQGNLGNNQKCQELFSHFLGAISHSISDINFDRYFVRAVADQSYGGDISRAQKFTDLWMDMVVLAENRGEFKPLSHWAPLAEILPIYRQAGIPVESGTIGRRVRLQFVLRRIALICAGIVTPFARPVSPWAAENYMTARGGVNDTAQVVATTLDAIWEIVAVKPQFSRIPEISFQGGWPDTNFEIVAR